MLSKYSGNVFFGLFYLFILVLVRAASVSHYLCLFGAYIWPKYSKYCEIL